MPQNSSSAGFAELLNDLMDMPGSCVYLFAYLFICMHISEKGLCNFVKIHVNDS